MQSWIPALAGGALIGLAAVLLYATAGRIAGISGISYGSLWLRGSERHWRLVFLAGLIGGGALMRAAGVPLPEVPLSPTGLWLMIGSGLLVGFGTRIGNGCTSGHGICGLGQRSPRSLAAVVVFMAVGVLVATLLRPLLV